jgi:hypothetical protein
VPRPYTQVSAVTSLIGARALGDLSDSMIDQSLQALFLIPIDITAKESFTHPE